MSRVSSFAILNHERERARFSERTRFTADNYESCRDYIIRPRGPCRFVPTSAVSSWGRSGYRAEFAKVKIGWGRKRTDRGVERSYIHLICRFVAKWIRDAIQLIFPAMNTIFPGSRNHSSENFKRHETGLRRPFDVWRSHSVLICVMEPSITMVRSASNVRLYAIDAYAGNIIYNMHFGRLSPRPSQRERLITASHSRTHGLDSLRRDFCCVKLIMQRPCARDYETTAIGVPPLSAPCKLNFITLRTRPRGPRAVSRNEGPSACVVHLSGEQRAKRGRAGVYIIPIKPG